MKGVIKLEYHHICKPQLVKESRSRQRSPITDHWSRQWSMIIDIIEGQPDKLPFDGSTQSHSWSITIKTLNLNDQSSKSHSSVYRKCKKEKDVKPYTTGMQSENFRIWEV